MTIDSITLEVLWNRLIAVVNEQAAALMRTSFTSIPSSTHGPYAINATSLCS